MIRERLIPTKAFGLLTSWLLRAWLGSLEFRFVVDDPAAAPHRMPRHGLYVFWHEMLLLPAYTHGSTIATLVSFGRDGDLIANVLHYWRGRTVRGSTDHQGGRALREMLRLARQSHLGLAVEHPQGPARVVAPGAIFLASRSRMPVVPVGLAPSRWRRVGPAGRRIALPLPFCRVRVVAGRPIRVPADLDRNGLERWRRKVQAAMDQVQSRAERLAAGAARSAGTSGAGRRLLTPRQVQAL